MSMRRLMLTIAALLGAAAGQSRTAGSQRTQFPHAKHARLFLSCAACHAGVTTGDNKRVYPSPATCAQCHNDRDEKVVVWTPPAPRATNLKFTHLTHLAKSTEAGSPAQCVSCHATAIDTSWMHVRTASPTACVSCHAHSAPEHLAETAGCQTCHTSLAQARGLSVERIAAFPKPASHTRADFVSNHALASALDISRCATCHTRESCARCHANAQQVPAIRALAMDARVAELTRGRAATYPTPATHLAADWATTHGQDATRSAPQCANCHTQPSCRSCHAGQTAPAAIAALPMPITGGPPGVALAKVTVHPSNFLTHHQATAASGRLDCAGCHQERECTSCHVGSSARRYHPVDFISRHAPAAFGQEQTCTSCHQTETFCRSCHLKSGITTAGATSGAAHTAQPLWLLQHGEAARRGLTGCTTCHQQRDCLRCHSGLGLQVNPHGDNFDASRISTRNKQVCTVCHATDPLKR